MTGSPFVGRSSGRVDAGVFQHDDGVADVAARPLCRQIGLHVPRREIIHRAQQLDRDGGVIVLANGLVGGEKWLAGRSHV